MRLKNNATYQFISRADPLRALNVYGSSGSVPSSQKNVCLYKSNPKDTCQQWVYKEVGGHKFLVCKNNQNLALDMYTGSPAAQNMVNAHVYAPSNTSYLGIVDTDSGYVKIYLTGYANKFLTANQGNNGDNNGRTTHDPGNVYWYKDGLTDNSQEWKPIPVDDGGFVDPQPPEDGKTLRGLKRKFPNGKYWNHVGMSGNNQDGYTNSPCPNPHNGTTCNHYVFNGEDLASQCQGFVMKCGYDAYGSSPYTWPQITGSNALDSLKPGDIVRYYTTDDKHSIFVTAVSGDTITFGDCNSDFHCKIRWDATTTKQKLRPVLKAVYRAPFELK